ncbi:PREDICTED: protein FAR1-RELATED SEQUENCE 7-like [Ipomoea nil]|uniref:protein FAR1-RELATED SEQUENCE 7-like n=2 Tax=Ipomoea nil TaxID=35883 RepID=UPI000901B24C|nr:PREDICTED: protein FAR1-RELATED SEQUENCE 7-like [Ipomoea nil]
MVIICKLNVVIVDEDLVGVVVRNVDEAFELYNGYAYRVGFSVRKGQQRYKASTKSIQMKRFFCAKAGYKQKPNSGVKLYSKIDMRTGCGAFVQFDVGGDGMWTVTKHLKEHNHELCSFGKSHLLRSHRRVGNNQLEYLKDMKSSGVALADGMRFLKHQSGGSPLVGFTNRDAYNSMASVSLKCLDGSDSNSLVEIFRRRQSNEADFFFDFETIMTDQCSAMAAGISMVFPTSRHRLCIWHIGENSKKHIKALRNHKDFLDMFNCVLKYTETEAEFEVYWTRMVTKYNCHKNTWLEKLYDCREKWCPAFNKDYFSGGILSSQRSESTNHAISRRLSKTAGLCDFYSSFVSVISEWRSKENGEDFRCSQGVPAMMLDHVKLLSHARECKYHVWRPDIDIIRHEVTFKAINLDICCSCKLFSELGILCCHCLRILHVHCVSSILDKYILKRWTKKAVERTNVDIASVFYNGGVPSSIWAVEISRKFQRLIVSSQDNSVARQLCDEAVENARKNIEAEIGDVNTEEGAVSSSSGIVQDPSSRRGKGVRNKRSSSVIEKKYNAARGRKSAANKLASITKGSVQSLVLENISEIARDGYLVHPSTGGSQFVHFNKNVDHDVAID